MKKVTGLIAFLSFLALLPFAQASSLTEPQLVIENTSNQIKLILKRDRHLLESDPSYVYKMVDEVLIPNVDLDRVSSLVLGRFWKKTTDDQKKSFKYEFKRMLVRTYATAFNELDDWNMTYLASRQGKTTDDILVRTKVTGDGPPVAVDYRMRDGGQGWKVYDVKIEGMSLVTNYRSSFNRLIRTSGMDGLLTHLRENNDQKAVSPIDDSTGDGKVSQVASN